ncbi:MAG: hypothetical protein M3371_06715 [Acidobacteriota bacterium]|nr:hypothetical protein [Acidobacteriota bacterium]
MKNNLKRISAALLITIFSLSPVFAGDTGDENLLIDARVVEVTEKRISVVAQTGVEHVIAINSDTKVQMGERQVSVKDLQVGNVITIELDEKNVIKFAKLIEINQPTQTEVAQIPQ